MFKVRYNWKYILCPQKNKEKSQAKVFQYFIYKQNINIKRLFKTVLNYLLEF